MRLAVQSQFHLVLCVAARIAISWDTFIVGGKLGDGGAELGLAGKHFISAPHLCDSLARRDLHGSCC